MHFNPSPDTSGAAWMLTFDPLIIFHLFFLDSSVIQVTFGLTPKLESHKLTKFNFEGRFPGHNSRCPDITYLQNQQSLSTCISVPSNTDAKYLILRPLLIIGLLGLLFSHKCYQYPTWYITHIGTDTGASQVVTNKDFVEKCQKCAVRFRIPSHF